MKTYIFWSDEWYRRVAQEIVFLERKHPDWSDRKVLRSAQEILPSEARRKTLSAIQQYKKLERYVREMRSNPLPRHRKKPKAPVLAARKNGTQRRSSLCAHAQDAGGYGADFDGEESDFF